MEGLHVLGALLMAGAVRLWVGDPPPPTGWPMSYLSPLSAAALGTLDFSLLYDQENNALHCTISKAKVGPRQPPRSPGVQGPGWR